MQLVTEYSLTEPLSPLAQWFQKKLSQLYSLDTSSIEVHQPISSYGLDSMNAMAIAGELEEMLDIELPATLLWDYPTIAKAASYIEYLLTEANAA